MNFSKMFFATQFVDISSWHTCGINNCPKLSFPGRHGVSELLLDTISPMKIRVQSP